MRREWPRRCCWRLCLLVVLLCGSATGLLAESLAVGSQLPRFTLPAPDSEPSQAYLGLKTREAFPLAAIKAKAVLIDFVSATCPHCLANAPVVNRLYRIIQEDPSLAKDVKIIGVALGSDQAKTTAFKKTTKTAFPLFPDAQLDIAAAVDVQETPTLILASTSGKVLTVHSGPIKDLDGFLKELREALKTL